jgi:hypothetical protein
VLEGEELARAAPAAHDLVADQQDAVLVEQRAQPLEVALRRRQDAVGAGDRLDDHGRDGLRPLVHDDLFEVGEVVLHDLLLVVAEAVRVRVRVHHPDHPGMPGSLAQRRGSPVSWSVALVAPW